MTNLSTAQEPGTPLKTSKQKKAENKKIVPKKNSCTADQFESDSDLDPDHLSELLEKAKNAASNEQIPHRSKILETKAFKDGKFTDPIGDLVKNQLYIQDVNSKINTQRKGNSEKNGSSLEKKSFEEGSHSGTSSDPVCVDLSHTGIEQALKISKLKGIEELKIKNTLSIELSKAEKKRLKESNAGSKWFNMPAPVMTPELKRDLELLSLRNVLDRKRFYKKSDKQPNSKFLQVGTIIEDKSEFYSARISKRDRKSTMVQEILHDSESQDYFTSRFNQLQQESARNCRKPSVKKFKGYNSKRR